jgi:hypothetical protein
MDTRRNAERQGGRSRLGPRNPKGFVVAEDGIMSSCEIFADNVDETIPIIVLQMKARELLAAIRSELQTSSSRPRLLPDWV